MPRASKRQRNMMREDGSEVTCERCGLKFVPSWSEKEALAELDENHPELPSMTHDNAEHYAVMCDECYAAFQAWWAALPESERTALAKESREEMGVPEH